MARDSRSLICVAVGSVLVAGLSATGLGQGFDLDIFSSALFVLVALLATLVAIAHRQSVLDNPVYVALYSYVAFVGVGPLVTRVVEAFSWSSGALTGRGAGPLLLAWIGLASLGLGYWSGRPRGRNRNVGSTPTTDQNGKVNFLLYGGWALTFLGVAGVVLYLSGLGGISYLLRTPYGQQENLSIYAGFINMLQPGLFLLVVWALTRVKVSVWSSIALFLYAAFDMFWFGPLSGTRQFVIVLALTLACLLKYCGLDRGKPRTKLLLVGRYLLMAPVVAILIWGSVRHYSVADLLAGEASEVDVGSGTEYATTHAIYAPYEAFVTIVDLVPSEIHYQWGSTFYESLTVFIPRKLWPSKPTSVADWLTETVYGIRAVGNSVATWPGELYLDFGVPGVIVGMIMMGGVCARMTRWRPSGSSSRPSCFQGVLYSVSFALPLQWMWGGSNSAVWYFLSNIGPVLAVILLARLSRAKSKLPIHRVAPSKAVTTHKRT